MAHYIYRTEGIVLSKNNFGEADQLISFYTAELGGVRAVAQGVRFLKSKLRYHLGELSYSKIAFVRGREYWRIIDAEEILNLENIKTSPFTTNTLANTIKLLNRLIQGEENEDKKRGDLKNGGELSNETAEDRGGLTNFELIMG